MNKRNEITSTRRVLKITVTTVVFAVLVGALATGSAAGQTVSSCADDINTAGQYEVTGNITNSTVENCITIAADDIVLDGQGHKVDGVNQTLGSDGITVNANNVTVKNFGNVTGWETGIQVLTSRNATLTDNTANNNGNTGIELGASSRNDLTGNTANNNNAYGIWIQDGSNFNNLTDNVVRDNSGAGGDTAGIYIGSVQQVSNNRLVNNIATGDQTYGIYLMQADENELIDNKANLNNEAGIYLTGDSSDNDLIDNIANFNGEGFEGAPGIYGIWLDDNSNNNNLTGNEALNNGASGFAVEEASESEEVNPNLIAPGPVPSAGIYLGGFSEGSPVFNNRLVDNDAGNFGPGPQQYGIWLSQASGNRLIDNTANENLQYGIWLSQESTDNELIGNLAEDNGGTVGPPVSISEGHGDYVEGSSGIYVGGVNGGSEPALGNNTLVDNTARGSEYGIWIRNSFNNSVSESLAEDNHEGIAVEFQEIQSLEETVSPAEEGDGSITFAGNTFTDDTSRNNDWDFVSKVPLDLITEPDITNPDPTDTSLYPVTNLNIGASTKPDTTLSFLSPDIRLRSVRSTEPDPEGLTNIGRYFEAESTETDPIIVEQEELVPLLFAVVSYEDADITGVDESTLELRRFNETAGEWQALENPLLDEADNLVVGATSGGTSNFGIFGEGGCINRRDLGRGQEDQECAFDRDIDRGGSRRGLDRNTGRGGDGEHSDSETARRDRGRGDTRSR